MKITSALILSILFTGLAQSQTRTQAFNQDKELGTVSWYRDYDQALLLSKKQNKPVLILFQEVPGCATCRNYGQDVLSDPLLAEAIENEFIPLAIFNNKSGKDAAILKKFKEPSWNNPVIRIVDSNGYNIVPRVAGNYSTKGLYKAMRTALQYEEITAPPYFDLLGEALSLHPDITKEAVYTMYCFWSGEKELGAVTGVVNTEAGFAGGREVVKVTFDSKEISRSELDKIAKSKGNSPFDYPDRFVPSINDEDYYLNRSLYKYLPLSPLQRTKINSYLGYGKDARELLSPGQIKWLDQLESSNLKKTVRSKGDFKTSFNLLKRERSS